LMVWCARVWQILPSITCKLNPAIPVSLGEGRDRRSKGNNHRPSVALNYATHQQMVSELQQGKQSLQLLVKQSQ